MDEATFQRFLEDNSSWLSDWAKNSPEGQSEVRRILDEVSLEFEYDPHQHYDSAWQRLTNWIRRSRCMKR